MTFAGFCQPDEQTLRLPLRSRRRFMAAELLPTGFFEGIDVMIPVPLHYRKQRIRGYNQSEWITRGVSRVTGIHVDTSLVIREKPTETQTRKSVYERWENVEGGFKLLRPDGLAGKHVLIIDDVLTTGATRRCVS